MLELILPFLPYINSYGKAKLKCFVHFSGETVILLQNDSPTKFLPCLVSQLIPMLVEQLNMVCGRL